MPSQESSAVPPKRASGRARVEALLDAAGAVFAERGYDKATMTEIAARSVQRSGRLGSQRRERTRIFSSP